MNKQSSHAKQGGGSSTGFGISLNATPIFLGSNLPTQQQEIAENFSNSLTHQQYFNIHDDLEVRATPLANAVTQPSEGGNSAGC